MLKSRRTASILAAAIAANSATAATLYWDGDATGTGNSASTGTGLGTSGSWNNSLSGSPLLNWWPGTGTTDQAWANAGNNTAAFWGTAGTVTLTDPITVGGLQFNTTGYTIDAAANPLTFAAGSTITLNSPSAAAFTATITGSVAGAGAVTITRGSPSASVSSFGSTLVLNGTSATGWSGATTIDNGVTVSLSGLNQALVSTSAITLSGGITLTNVAAQAALDRVSNTATITSNGGAITYANAATTGTNYTETIGAVVLNSGALNVALTNATTGTETQTLTINTGGITRTGSTNTSTVAFSAAGGLNSTTSMIKVTGATATPAGQIIGPWATVGTTAAAQTDYAIYDGATNVVGANITASAESVWAAGATAVNTLNGASTLTATRNMNALRYTGNAQTLALAGNNLETNGILNGGTGLLTISGTGSVRQQGTVAGALFVTAGNNAITINSNIVDNTGALTLVKAGSSTLTLGGTNTYTGDTVILAGAVTAGSASAVKGNLIVGSQGGGPAASFTGATVTAFNTAGTTNLTVYSNGSATFSNTGGSYLRNVNIVGGLVTSNFGYFSSTGVITMTGGTLAGGIYGSNTNITTTASAATATISASISTGSSNTFTVADGAAAIDLDYTGARVSPGYGTDFIKAGAGVMALGGANGHTGITSVTGGTLLLRNSLALQSSRVSTGGTGIVFDSSVATHAFTIGGLSGGSTVGLVLQDNASTPNAVTLTLNVAVSSTYAGVLSGPGGVTKTGVGTQTLTGASTYTSATTVNAGTLKAGVASVAGVSGAFGKNSAVTMANVAMAALDITGFNTQIGSLTGGGTTGGNVTLGSANLSVGGDNTSPAAYAGVISGTGGVLTKIGNGTQILTGANLYTGGTSVTGGKLLVNNNTGSGTGTGLVTVNTGATLGGTGTVGSVTLTPSSNSTFSPGVSIGMLSTGNLGLTNNNFAIDLSKAAERESLQPIAATDYDQASVTGTVDVSGGNLVLSVGSGLTNGDVYYILVNDSADGVTGTFSKINGAAPVLDGSATTLAQGGMFDITSNGVLLRFAISYNAVADSTFSDSITPGNDIALQAVSVPEPASMGLIALGLGSTLLRRRRRTSAV